jgi:hypothetical protein
LNLYGARFGGNFVFWLSEKVLFIIICGFTTKNLKTDPTFKDDGNG